MEVVNKKCSTDLLDIETYISTENMLQDYEGIKKASKLPTSGTFTQFQIGDVLFSNIRPYLKKVWQAEFNGSASNDIIVFRAKSGLNPYYLSQIIKSDSFIAHSMSGAKGVKMPRGDRNLMLDYLVFMPTFAEQKRIAGCLYSIDNMISEYNNKLEQLKSHKKGLMQQLFASINGGGNSLVPRLRFPEFNNTKEWEVKKLGDICTFLDNKRIPLKDSERAKIHGRYPYYGASGIIDYVNNYIFDGEYILLSEDGANIILRNSPLAFIIKGKCWVNNHAHVLETKAGNNIYYVCHLLESMNYESLNTGTAQPKLNRENCEKIELPIPSFEEQCKIAESLNSIDNMVISYSDKMTMLQQHKKGLMQQMFPNDQMN